MKHQPPLPADPPPPTDDEISDHARELYVRSGRIPGRELENWLEAEAGLRSFPPAILAPLHCAARRRSPQRRRFMNSP